MPYVRLSLMRAKAGHQQDVARMMEDLIAFYATQPGYIDGYLLRPADDRDEIGRVTIWRSEADTDAAAQTTHVLSERSELLPLIEENSHVERSFEAEGQRSAPSHRSA